MTLITHTNYASLLKESTNPRGSSPNGNVYFDAANNLIDLIGVDALPTVDFGGGAVPNPLTAFDGITLRALYNFENSRRRVNETLRKFERGTKGNYRFAGAFAFINGVKLANAGRSYIRSSGWIEYANTGDGTTAVDRIYHGVVSLVDVQDTTVPYYALVSATDEASLQAATWANFARVGDINEAVQVFGSTANGDSGAGNFDYTARTLVVRVRSWAYNPGETTSVATGITEFSGFSAGYGVGETLDPNNSYALADVYGAARIAPWTGMALKKVTTPQVEAGFNEGSGAFSWVLTNTAGGTANQCAAFLAALALQDTDIDSGSGTYNGRKGRVWFTRNASGKIVTSSIGGAGLFIEGLSAAEKQNVIFTANDGTSRTYPFFPTVEISVGSVAPNDPNCWYHAFYLDGSGSQDFDSAGAVTVNDNNGNPVKGNVAAAAIGGKITFAYSYDTNTQAGLAAGVDKQMVVEVEGDGIAAQALTTFTVTRSTVIPVTCAPAADTNA